MYGAILGDISGSIYEYEQFKNVSKVNVQDLLTRKSFYSDDTILTIAILDCILNNGNYENYLKEYANKYKDYKPDFKPYFKDIFSPGFTKWVNNEKLGNSVGNGAMMRVSPIGYLFDNEGDIHKNVVLATSPSHNNPVAIDYAEIIALIIFYSRKGLNKKEIINKLNIKLNYEDFEEFNYTCSDTLDNCLYAFFKSKSLDDAIKTVISYGGDTDTNACIVGSMSEAYYGISDNLKDRVNEYLPDKFIDVLDEGYKKIKVLK